MNDDLLRRAEMSFSSHSCISCAKLHTDICSAVFSAKTLLHEVLCFSVHV